MARVVEAGRVLGSMAVMGLVVVAAACGDDRDRQARAAEGAVALAVAAPETVVREPVSTPVESSTPVQPRYENVTYAEAEAVFRRGRYEEARDMFGAYVETHPSNASGHYLLGLSAWKSGDHGRAEQALVRAVELDGESVKIRTNLGRVLLERGRPADALPHLETAIELDPMSHEVWRVLGNAYSQLGRSMDAIDSYREALRLNDRDAWTMNNYGLVLIRIGRFDDAVLPLARAVQLMPGSALFRNNLGVALERTGELGGARAAFAAAVEADSTNTKAVTNLERVTARIGDRDVAEFDLSVAAGRFIEELQTWGSEDEHDC